jgi:hypothetical protein
MPHFGLIDEDALGPVESQLMRAKLHIRCGKRRLREGKISMGILTLYDALNSAMQWYIAIPENRMTLKTNEGENLNDDDTVYAVLTRCGILDGSFDYDAFNELVEEALNQEMSDYDFANLLKGIEPVMTQLGVMPFDESTLPPEDPSTF